MLAACERCPAPWRGWRLTTSNRTDESGGREHCHDGRVTASGSQQPEVLDQDSRDDRRKAEREVGHDVEG